MPNKLEREATRRSSTSESIELVAERFDGVDRQTIVDGSNRSENSRLRIGGIHRCTNLESGAPFRSLEHRHIEHERGRFAQIVDFDVPNLADNLKPALIGPIGRNAHESPDWICVAKKVSGSAFIHDGNFGRPGAIGSGEFASVQNRCLHGSKVVWAYRFNVDRGQVFALPKNTALHLDAAVAHVGGEGFMYRKGHAANAGDSLNSLLHLLVERNNVFVTDHRWVD